MSSLAAVLLSLGMTNIAPIQPATTPDASLSELRPLIERYEADRGALQRFFTIAISPGRRKALTDLAKETETELKRLPIEKLSRAGQVDALVFRHHLQYTQEQARIDQKEFEQVADLVPFAATLIGLEESRRQLTEIDNAATAATLNQMVKDISALRKKVADAHAATPRKRSDAFRAARYVDSLRTSTKNWFDYREGYDPLFTWWMKEPYRKLDAELAGYADFLREKIGGVAKDDTTAIIGDPIGRDALIHELKSEMIPLTPEEMLKIAEREFAWCDAEMLKASQDLGFGSDWKKALEKVKQDHVGPGEQPQMIRELALEAIKFVEDNELVSVPELAKRTWRMEMLSPQAQAVSPFFLGGEMIQVSFPTDDMSHDAKMMSMRGNNRHFARATVHHELIPGHHLQQFMLARHATHRGLFSTPFWTEGWALWFEFLLWDKGFPKTPENRIGMLFWRMHRCARIIFSLSFHLDRWTPQQCIDFLVDRVGHERANAEAEVRRSFAGNYGPLYQLAYMIGGLQFKALHSEMVGSGKLTDRQFHDAVLHQGNIPIAALRAALGNEKLTWDTKLDWRFGN